MQNSFHEADGLRKACILELSAVDKRVKDLIGCLTKKDYLLKLQSKRPKKSNEDVERKRKAAETLVRVIGESYQWFLNFINKTFVFWLVRWFLMQLYKWVAKVNCSWSSPSQTWPRLTNCWVRREFFRSSLCLWTTKLEISSRPSLWCPSVMVRERSLWWISSLKMLFLTCPYRNRFSFMIKLSNWQSLFKTKKSQWSKVQSR